MSRTIRQRLLTGVGAAIALAGLPLFALADTEISARGWSHDRYGRLVFDRAARLTTGAEIKGRKLIITFSEPVSVKLTGALDNLKSYVAGPLSAPGRRIELDLARPATLERWEEEGKLVLDLRPASAWPAEQTAAKPTNELRTGGLQKDGSPKGPERQRPKRQKPKRPRPKRPRRNRQKPSRQRSPRRRSLKSRGSSSLAPRQRRQHPAPRRRPGRWSRVTATTAPSCGSRSIGRARSATASAATANGSKSRSHGRGSSISSGRARTCRRTCCRSRRWMARSRAST